MEKVEDSQIDKKNYPEEVNDRASRSWIHDFNAIPNTFKQCAIPLPIIHST